MSEYQAILQQPADGRVPVIGCHLSSAKGYAAMAKTAASIDANTFAFFTRNPRGGKAKAIDDADLQAFAEEAAHAGIGRIVAHGSYTVNPCAAKEQVRAFAFQALAEDLQRMERTPGQLFSIHPGSHVKQGAQKGIELIAEVLNAVLAPEQTTTLLLETMAGKGTEVGRSFEELAAIIERVELDSHVGVCLDTCHVWDAGYDIVNDLDGVLEEFDQVIGLERLRALHINDSLNPLGAHKDRHARIGEGRIGSEALAAVVAHPQLRGLPCILETPNELPGYAQEIAFFRSCVG
jgi:deoxyribonuclease-4